MGYTAYSYFVCIQAPQMACLRCCFRNKMIALFRTCRAIILILTQLLPPFIVFTWDAPETHFGLPGRVRHSSRLTFGQAEVAVTSYSSVWYGTLGSCGVNHYMLQQKKSLPCVRLVWQLTNGGIADILIRLVLSSPHRTNWWMAVWYLNSIPHAYTNMLEITVITRHIIRTMWFRWPLWFNILLQSAYLSVIA